jgi:hypothetical protein
MMVLYCAIKIHYWIYFFIPSKRIWFEPKFHTFIEHYLVLKDFSMNSET